MTGINCAQCHNHECENRSLFMQYAKLDCDCYVEELKVQTVWYVGFFADYDVYYLPAVFSTSDKAYEYFHKCYFEYMADLIEEEFLSEEEACDRWIAAINNANDPDYYPMVNDMYVDCHIPEFGYVQEFGVQ